MATFFMVHWRCFKVGNIETLSDMASVIQENTRCHRPYLWTRIFSHLFFTTLYDVSRVVICGVSFFYSLTLSLRKTETFGEGTSVDVFSVIKISMKDFNIGILLCGLCVFIMMKYFNNSTFDGIVFA
jgi:hypothetical protein